MWKTWLLISNAFKERSWSKGLSVKINRKTHLEWSQGASRGYQLQTYQEEKHLARILFHYPSWRKGFFLPRQRSSQWDSPSLANERLPRLGQWETVMAQPMGDCHSPINEKPLNFWLPVYSNGLSNEDSPNPLSSMRASSAPFSRLACGVALAKWYWLQFSVILE